MALQVTNGLETAPSSWRASSLLPLSRERECLLDAPATPSVAAATPLTTPAGTALPPGPLLFQCSSGFARSDFDLVYLLSIPRPSDMLQTSARCFLQLLPPALLHPRSADPPAVPASCLPGRASPACPLLPSAALLPWSLAQPFPTSSRLFISLKAEGSPGWPRGSLTSRDSSLPLIPSLQVLRSLVTFPNLIPRVLGQSTSLRCCFMPQAHQDSTVCPNHSSLAPQCSSVVAEMFTLRRNSAREATSPPPRNPRFPLHNPEPQASAETLNVPNQHP